MSIEEDIDVIGSSTGSWLWQRECGRVVPFKFASRESAQDCLPGTISVEFDGDELVGGA